MKLDPLHAASAQVIEAVQGALREGLVVGLVHPIWSGPSACAFSSLEAYLECVRQSDPGYLVTLWSIPELDRCGVLLLRGHSDGLDPVRDWLNAAEGREYLAVGIIDGVARVAFGGIREFEELVDLARQADPSRDFAVLPLSELFEGGLYSPRLHFVNAERANEHGEVPTDKIEAARMRTR